MARSISQIDKDIFANRRTLMRRQSVPNQFSSADWQRAWDAEPALKAEDDALWRERGEAQLERDRKAHEAAMKAVRASRVPASKPRRCPSCNALLAA